MGMFDGILGAVTNIVGGFIGNEQSRDAAEDNRTFQMNMSNTAYSRAVDDLKHAGLNPMLAYHANGIGPLSTPPGSSYTASNPAAGASTAYSAALVRGQVEQLEAGNAKLRAETAVALEEAERIRTQTKLNTAQEALAQASATERSDQAAVHRQTVSYLQAQADRLAELNGLTRAEIDQVRANIPRLVAEGKLYSAEEMTTRSRDVLLQLDVPEAINRARYATATGMLDPGLSSVGKALSSAGQVTGMYRDWAIGQRYGSHWKGKRP